MDTSSTQAVIDELETAIENNPSFQRLNSKKLKEEKEKILTQVFGEKNTAKKREERKKLEEYRYVDDLSEFKYGAFVRWYNLTDLAKHEDDLAHDIGDVNNLKLQSGAFFTDVHFTSDGTRILLRSHNRRFMKLDFDTCVTFQKLSHQELLLLQVFDALETI